jgi:hypothetical protein
VFRVKRPKPRKEDKMEERERQMSQEQGNRTQDPRRYGIIETRFRQAGKVAMYDLAINEKL